MLTEKAESQGKLRWLGVAIFSKVAEGGECQTKLPVEDLDYAKNRYEQKESNKNPTPPQWF